MAYAQEKGHDYILGVLWRGRRLLGSAAEGGESKPPQVRGGGLGTPASRKRRERGCWGYVEKKRKKNTSGKTLLEGLIARTDYGYLGRDAGKGGEVELEKEAVGEEGSSRSLVVEG